MLFTAALALIQPGDEVLTPDPGFPIYESVVRFAGGRPVYYPLDESRAFAPDVAAIADRITPRTRVIILNLPHNPTGGVAAADDLTRLAALAQQRSEEHTSELQSRFDLVCRLLLEKKKEKI